MGISASMHESHPARRLPLWKQGTQGAILHAVGCCTGADRRPMPFIEESEENVAASTGPSRSAKTQSSPVREGRATLQPLIERSLVIKGEVTGTECLYIEGKIEGMVHLAGSRLTVGKTGDIMADIDAREIIVLGQVRGNCRASERVDIRKGGSVMGNVITPRISIDDDAYFKGGVEIRNPGEVKQSVVAVGESAPSQSQESQSQDRRAEESSSHGRHLKREDGADEDDALPKWKLEERKSAARKTVKTH